MKVIFSWTCGPLYDSHYDHSHSASDISLQTSHFSKHTSVFVSKWPTELQRITNADEKWVSLWLRDQTALLLLSPDILTFFRTVLHMDSCCLFIQATGFELQHLELCNYVIESIRHFSLQWHLHTDDSLIHHWQYVPSQHFMPFSTAL